MLESFMSKSLCIISHNVLPNGHWILLSGLGIFALIFLVKMNVSTNSSVFAKSALFHSYLQPDHVDELEAEIKFENEWNSGGPPAPGGGSWGR